MRFCFQLQIEPGLRLEVVGKINHIKYSFAIDTGSTVFIINADNSLIQITPKVTDCTNYGKLFKLKNNSTFIDG